MNFNALQCVWNIATTVITVIIMVIVLIATVALHIITNIGYLIVTLPIALMIFIEWINTITHNSIMQFAHEMRQALINGRKNTNE